MAMLHTMANTIPTTEPSQLRAGDTWAWRREDLGDYPASAWTLTYYFRSKTAYFDVTATADGDAFSLTVAKATTASKGPGNYDWIAVVTSATERHEVDRGRVEVLPDYSEAAALDTRSFARKMLDAIEDALLNRASTDQLDLLNAALADRSLSRDKGGMIALRNQFRAEVRREEDALRMRKGLPPRNRILAVA